jgi:hypothetical protein
MERSSQNGTDFNESLRKRKQIKMMVLTYILLFILTEVLCKFLGRGTLQVIKFLFTGFRVWSYAPAYLWLAAFPPPLLYFVLFIWHLAFFLCYYWITEPFLPPKKATIWLIVASWFSGYVFLLIAFGPARMWQYATTWILK